MQKLLVERGLTDNIELDSAGIIDVHQGQLADRRMREHAAKRGLNITHQSRPVNTGIDFDYFDMIIGMDDENMHALRELARTPEQKSKLHKMTDFRMNMTHTHVPDPYYASAQGFELVLDILEDACEGLLQFLHNTK